MRYSSTWLQSLSTESAWTVVDTIGGRGACAGTAASGSRQTQRTARLHGTPIGPASPDSCEEPGPSWRARALTLPDAGVGSTGAISSVRTTRGKGSGSTDDPAPRQYQRCVATILRPVLGATATRGGEAG